MNKGLPVLLTMTILSSIALSSTFVSADTEVIDTVELTVPIACTMSGTGTTHTATLNPGTYSAASGSDHEAGIGKTTLTAICNDDNGFSIYAIGFTGNQYEGENHTKLIGTNTGGTIATKAYVSGDTSSNWSMKLTKVDNPVSGDPVTYNPQNLTITTSYDTWHAVPDTYTKVAEYHANTGSSTTDTTLGVKLETTYAAYIASNQAADTYIGQVKYTMVHPYDEQPLGPRIATSGCINYFPNGNNVEGTMGCQSAADGNSIDLLASNFSRTGYGFAGWSDKFDYATNPNAHFYGPQEIITVPTGVTANGLSLYAVWVPSAGSLQDSSKVSELCGTGQGSLTTTPTNSTANLASVSALTDQRDNQTYAIAKLADGKCWMIENLRLEAENTRSPEDIALAQGYGTSITYGNFIGLADAESANFAADTSSSSVATANSIYYTGTQEGTASIDIGTTSWPGLRIPRYNNTNTTSRASSPTSNTVNLYSYGNYYTWPATIANTSAYGSNNTIIADTSICPKEWRPPTGGQAYASGSTGGVNVTGDVSTFSDYYNLGYIIMGITAYEVNNNSGSSYYSNNRINNNGDTANKAFRKFPNNFITSGDIEDSSISGRGSVGGYWTSSASSVGDYYWRPKSSEFSLSTFGVFPGTNAEDRFAGHSIRCVAP